MTIKKSKSRRCRRNTRRTTCKNGYYYGPVLNNYCKCYQTYTGKKCEKKHKTKQIDAVLSQVIFASKWIKKYVPKYTVSPTYELNYEPWQFPHSAILLSSSTRNKNVANPIPFPTDHISVVLYDEICKLHKLTKNAVTKDKYIVIANGATLLVNAIIYAVLKKHKNRDIKVGAPVPAWPHFHTIPEYIRGSKWETGNSLDIEFITIPNNPDGNTDFKSKTNTKYVVHDLVYYWPSCMGGSVPAIRNDDIMTFSLSKLAAHSGSRFGWALVKDKQLAKDMANYIYMSQLAISGDTQLRAINVIRAINKNIGKSTDMFKYISNILQSRWIILNKIFSNSPRFEIASKNHFNFIVWIKSLKNENAVEVFSTYGITGGAGAKFGAIVVSAEGDADNKKTVSSKWDLYIRISI